MSPGCGGVGGGAYAIILFVEAGVRAARGSAQGVAFESYSAGLLLLPDLSRISGFTMRACSGAVLRSPMTWSVLLCASCVGGVGIRPLAGRVREGACPVRDGRGWCPRSTTGPAPEGIWRGEGTHVRVLAGLRLIESVTLVTTTVVRDTPLDCHFSAWSRPKPAPDPLPGPSVASGVIPTKGGRNGVLQPPAGRAPQGRWRSSPWKRCNHVAPRGRGQGAPRTARCIKTHEWYHDKVGYGQGAPRTARCIDGLGRSRRGGGAACLGVPHTSYAVLYRSRYGN